MLEQTTVAGTKGETTPVQRKHGQAEEKAEGRLREHLARNIGTVDEIGELDVFLAANVGSAVVDDHETVAVGDDPYWGIRSQHVANDLNVSIARHRGAHLPH